MINGLFFFHIKLNNYNIFISFFLSKSHHRQRLLFIFARHVDPAVPRRHGAAPVAGLAYGSQLPATFGARGPSPPVASSATQ